MTRSAGPGALDHTVLPVHPRTGLAAIGLVGGKPVWPVLGGSGEGDQTGTSSGQAPQPPAPPAPQPQPPSGQEPNQQPQDVASLPDWAQKIITDTRAEAARHRTNGQTATQQAQAAQQQRDAVLKALGLTPEGQDTPPDTATLTAQIEQQQAVAWTASVELNVFRTAQAAGANGEALLDSRAFIDSLDDFTADDPSGPDFRTKLDAHIRKYVEQHPQFKTAPTTTAPTRSGSDRPAGGSGTPPQRTQGLGAAIRAHYQQR